MKRFARSLLRFQLYLRVFNVSGIAFLFLASWLPLGLFSFFTDVLYPPGQTPNVSTKTFYLILAACHVIATSSAVSNPIVYGFLNANIRYEFVRLFSFHCSGDSRNKRNANVDDQTTTKTMLATSTQRKSGLAVFSLKSSERLDQTVSPSATHIDSLMVWIEMIRRTKDRGCSWSDYWPCCIVFTEPEHENARTDTRTRPQSKEIINSRKNKKRKGDESNFLLRFYMRDVAQKLLKESAN